MAGLRANTPPQHNRRIPNLMENRGFKGFRSWLAPMVLAVCGMIAAANPTWADASDVPASGRSLFDIMTTVVSVDANGESARLEVPFPFERLRALIKRAGGLSDADIAETLFPLGRSLQRRAAAPDYFASPRRVLGVIAEPPEADPTTTLVLKDRLFIGYQPRTDTIEVISFNEIAGRFEFQIVENYAPGKIPRVRQARRALCLGCHGNGGPIFPEAPWSETPANPAIAARLAEATGIPPPDLATIESNRRSAAALHRAVGRANNLLHASRYWADACGDPETRRTCEAELVPTMLEHRLSGRRSFGKGGHQTRRATETYLRAAQDRAWPDGFTLASPYIPDIDPLVGARGEDRDRADPLNQRPPLAVLDIDQPTAFDRIVGLLGDVFADRHINWFKNTFSTRVGDAGKPGDKVTRPRKVIANVPGYRLPGADRPATDGGIRGGNIMRAIAVRLGQSKPEWCCASAPGLPPPRAASPPVRPDVPGLSLEPGPAHPSLQAFHRACGTCHSGAGSAPPNFLFGPSKRQLQAITDCARLILKRLDQWKAHDDASPALPAPMPPPQHLASTGQSPEGWLASSDYRHVSRFTAALVEKRSKPTNGTGFGKTACPPSGD